MKHPFLVGVVLIFSVFAPLRAQWTPHGNGVRGGLQPVSLAPSPVPEGRKSILLAIASSLVLPGLGELYAGNFETGRYSLAAAAGLWLGYAGFQYTSAWIKDDARVYAADHASADFTGKDDQFLVNVSNYSSMDAYNTAKSRNRDYANIYTSTAYFWKWQTDEQRQHFRDLRVRSDEAKNNARFVTAALVVNRVISAFSAGRAAARYNESLDAQASLSVGVSPTQGPAGADGLTLHVVTTF